MERKSGMLQPGILYTLLAATVFFVAAGIWCLFLAHTASILLLCGIVLLLLAFALAMCLHKLRKTFRAFDDLDDIVEGWSRTPPEALEKSVKSLHGPAGVLGSSFYGKMRDMEENLAHVEEKARVKAEQSVEQRVVREVRDYLLPRVLENYPNRKNFEVSGIVEEVSGIVEDAAHPGSVFYDYFFIDPGLLCVSIAQFSQNGIPGLLQMIMAQTVLRGRLWAGSPLADAMSYVNARLFDYGSITEPAAMLAATLNTWSGEVTLVNAGLPSPLLQRSMEGYEWLDLPVSISLGQVANVRYQSSKLRLRAGNRLLLHTDGLDTMTDREGVPFREQALRATLNRSRAREDDLNHALHFLADEAKAYCDAEATLKDFSVLLLEFRKTVSEGHELTVSATSSSVSEVMAFIKTRLEENGKQPREYAPLVVLAEEVFALCCRKCSKNSSITLSCAVAPDTESVTLRLQAPFGGKNPIDTSESGPDGQAAEYITQQAMYVKYQEGDPNDTLMVVWFFAD